MNFIPVSSMITALLIFALIGQQVLGFELESMIDSSMSVADRFYESVIPATNEPFVIMRFAFNNGNPSDESTYCSNEDYIKIIDVFPLDMKDRRQLLRSNNKNVTTDMVPTSLASRDLYPLICRSACAGYSRGTCRATRCAGYRRRSLIAIGGQQATEIDNVCSSTMSLLHSNIDNLIVTNQVSSTCKTFLERTNRETYCALCNP